MAAEEGGEAKEEVAGTGMAAGRGWTEEVEDAVPIWTRTEVEEDRWTVLLHILGAVRLVCGTHGTEPLGGSKLTADRYGYLAVSLQCIFE